MVKYEGQMRTHIKIESQLRVHIDCMYDKIEEMTKEHKSSQAKNDQIILQSTKEIHKLKEEIEKEKTEKKELNESVFSYQK